jgi:hypothetical protein
VQVIATWRSSATTAGPAARAARRPRYHANSNARQTRFDLKDARGVPLVSFKRIRGLLQLSSEVEVHETASPLPELRWMVILGWYLTVMQHSDAAIVT